MRHGRGDIASIVEGGKERDGQKVMAAMVLVKLLLAAPVFKTPCTSINKSKKPTVDLLNPPDRVFFGIKRRQIQLGSIFSTLSLADI